MKTFTDAAGRTWTLTLTLGTAMKVKAKLDIDLLQPEAGDPPLLTRLGTDELLLGEVLCAMLEGQFEANKITDEDVRSSFDGQTLLAAQKAFYEELICFFRSRGRNDRAKAVAKQQALIEAAVAAVETRVDALDIDATIQNAMNTGETSGESPEASASTHVP
jgi:hypothetical protein